MGNKRSLSARRKAGKTEKLTHDDLPETLNEIMANLPPTSSIDAPEMGRGRRQRKPRTDISIPELEDTEEEEEEGESAKELGSGFSDIEEEGEHATEDEGDDLESEQDIEEVVVKSKRGCGRPPKQASARVSEPKFLILFVPAGLSDGSKMLKLPLSTSFARAINEIHTTIGCTEVLKKPTLQYKMPKTGRNPINLESEEDWDGFIQHATTLMQKSNSVNVEIVINKEYMEALRKKLGEKTKLSAATTSRGRRQRKKGDLNLDVLDDDEESKDDEAHARKVKDEFQKLKDSLSKCQVCGPEKFCKVNRFGKHVYLTAPQVLGWAHALASGTLGVSSTNPPRSEMFKEFHSGQLQTSEESRAMKEGPQAITSDSPLLMNQVSSAIALMMSGFNSAMMATALGNQTIPRLPGPGSGSTSTPTFTPPFTPALTPPVSNAQLAIGDYPVASNITVRHNFPEIDVFLQKLAEEDPRRQFDGLGEKLAAKRYFCIDELEDETPAFFQEEPYNLWEGDAKFLVRSIRAAILSIRSGN